MIDGLASLRLIPGEGKGREEAEAGASGRQEKVVFKGFVFISRSAARALTSRVVRPLRKALERPSIFHAASKYPWSFFGLL